MSLPDTNKLVSSANRTNFKTSETLPKSLMYNIYSKGPSMEPNGTPHTIFNNSESVPL